MLLIDFQAPAVVDEEKVLGKTKSGRVTKTKASAPAKPKKTASKKAPVKKTATPKATPKKKTETAAAT